ncbi:FUSC family protein [Francisella halioticida]|uniref:FUSC family protein n=1 Tax=Francisella halioticida TaxID=549298 RepID=UPI001FEB1F92|nr:FUSC family protein [Francisella halioticida]
MVSSGDPKKTLKTSLHRFFGTVIGACIGIILAYLVFNESYYFSVYSCFIFIF